VNPNPVASNAQVDLRSDTVTRPSDEMRRVIAAAEVGDHVLGDDPTAAELERYAAELLGKEAALFFPSGIMANQAAILLQAPPGTEVLLDQAGHILLYEEGAAAAWAGVQLRPVPSRGGLPDPEDYAAALPTRSRYLPLPSLLCVENTHNAAGGRVLSVQGMAAVAEVARERDLRIHLDGARLAHAAVATGRPMRDWGDLADTVMISLSKGLGAPIGSILAGSAEAMEQGWRIRRRLGGGMRQVGLLAAAGIFALKNNIDRLAEDHRRARDLARGIGDVSGIDAAVPDTNIVMLDIDPEIATAAGFVEELAARGIRMTQFGPRRLRAVLHMDVDDVGIARAIEAVREVAHPG
jgi:threonine aldolase